MHLWLFLGPEWSAMEQLCLLLFCGKRCYRPLDIQELQAVVRLSLSYLQLQPYLLEKRGKSLRFTTLP